MRFSDDELRSAISESLSWAEALRRLGYRSVGGNARTLQRHVERLGIATDHFDPDAVRRKGLRRARVPLDRIMVEESAYSRGQLKQRLFDEGIFARRCCLCGQGELWRGRRMALILDHINGVPNDHRLENLRIVCPNCAATFDTHCGRKNALPPITRECLRCGTSFRPKYLRHRYCSRDCGQRSHEGKRRSPQMHRRKVERPPYEQLVREIDELGYLGTGRRYGVSDNAIRKWVIAYERELEEEQRVSDDEGRQAAAADEAGSRSPTAGVTEAVEWKEGRRSVSR